MNFSQKSVISILGKFLGSALTLLSSIFFARLLGVTNLGQYQLLITIQTISITMLAMGFGNASIYFINNKKIDKTLIVSNILKLFSYIAVFLTIALSLSILIFPDFFGEFDAYAIIIFALGSGSLLLYNLLLPTFYVSLEVIKIQILSLLPCVIIVLGIVLSYSINKYNINVILSITGLSNLISFLVLLYFLRKNVDLSIGINKDLILDIFKYGFKLSVTNLVFILSSNIVIFLMKMLLDDGFDQVGLFSRAIAISNMFLIIPMSIGPLIYSKWSMSDRDSIGFEVEKTLRILIFISLCCSIVIFFFSGFILKILYGEAYLSAKNALNVLSFSVIFSSITIVLTNSFSSIGKPAITLKVFLISLFVTTIAGVLLIGQYKMLGAAIAVMIGLLFNAVLLVYYATREFNLSVKNSLFIRNKDLLLLKRKI